MSINLKKYIYLKNNLDVNMRQLVNWLTVDWHLSQQGFVLYLTFARNLIRSILVNMKYIIIIYENGLTTGDEQVKDSSIRRQNYFACYYSWNV